MPTFSLRPEGFADAKKPVLRNSFYMTILILVGSLIMANIPVLRGEREWEPIASLLPFAFLTGVFIWSFFRNMRRQKALWASYRLTLRDDALVREQQGYQTLTIPWEQVRVIEQTQKEDIIVKTGDKDLFIVIPAAVMYRDDVLRLLAEHAEITPQATVPLTVRYRWLILAVMLGSMVVFFTVRNPWIVVPLGLGIIGCFLYSINRIRNSVQIDARTRRIQFSLMFIALMFFIRILASLGVFDSVTNH